jgi:hypothetical protein
VELPFVSDHAPIVIQIDYGYNSVAYPFKFNPAFLQEESFCDLVHSFWGSHQVVKEARAQRRLSRKISRLKSQVKIWLDEKNKKELLQFELLEAEIAHLSEQYLEMEQRTDLITRLKVLES